jgi:hypothetical protein
MTNPFYSFMFVLYKLFVRPFKRTPARWSAIIFNDEGRFAVEQDSAGRRLPSGHIKPGYSIPHLCRNELGLDQSCFANKAALRLIGVEGRGGEEIVFYYSGEILRDVAHVRRFEDRVSYVEPSELGSFLPDDIGTKLRAKAA